LIEWHHGPSEGHVLELGPYFILPNVRAHAPCANERRER
jgi:hypothetical protein